MLNKQQTRVTSGALIYAHLSNQLMQCFSTFFAAPYTSFKITHRTSCNDPWVQWCKQSGGFSTSEDRCFFLFNQKHSARRSPKAV